MKQIQILQMILEIIENLENDWEYTPEEDTFGDGWNRAKYLMLKEIRLLIKNLNDSDGN